MPEYPDVVVYVERLRERIAGHRLRAVRLHSQFLLRTVTPTMDETNYCAHCQTAGKLLADRALSRLLHASWPKNIDELG